MRRLFTTKLLLHCELETLEEVSLYVLNVVNKFVHQGLG